MTTPQKNLRILFMHGLEAGPGGNKDRFLRQHFEHVCTPDMQMSIYRLTKSNSVLRNMLCLPLFFGWVIMATGTLLWVILSCESWAWLIWGVSFFSIFVIMRKILIRQALAASIDHSVEIQAHAIQEFQPDIVVGSSWGGFIALLCASRGIYTGPQLLIAPPVKLILDKLGDPDGNRWKSLCKSISSEAAQRILLVHGKEDATVPLADSQSLSAATDIELRIFSGDHSLNQVLLASPEDNKTNNQFQALIYEVVARLFQKKFL